MCGIAGILAGTADGGPHYEHALGAMTAALASRGPDGEGFYVAPPVGLGHRRLAIIDVEGGRQPLFSEDGAVAAIINGEIYNFPALRDELAGRGHRFATRSDSEVVVHGYEEWGDEVVQRLEGMFALAVWDARRRRLLLARDRMGEKPLFYAVLPGGGLAFASELKALRRAPGIAAEIDPAALARYLVYEYVPAPRSILRGVAKLEPGTLLTVSPGTAPALRRYWDLPLRLPDDPDRWGPADEERAVEALRAELRRSVRQRLVSDVPLGVFLSGGLDSSTVAALASEVLGGDLRTFSVGFDDPSFDESPAARLVARALGSRHAEERLSAAAVRDLLPRIGDLLDEPLGDGSIVPTHLLACFTRRHVTVALGGDGGDELFAGYPTFQAERVAAALLDPLPRPVSRLAIALGRAAAGALPVSLGYFSWDFKIKSFLKGAGLSGARRHQAWLGSLSPAEALGALSPDVAHAAGADLYDVVDERLARAAAAGSGSWDRLMYFYAKGYLGDDVLTKVDRASMAVGLEARAPFLDTGVIDLACRVAPGLRLRGLTTKYLLKRAAVGIVPREIIGRRKQGFGMPIGRWLKQDLRPLLEEDLSARRLAQDGLFQAPPVRRLVDEHVAGRADHRKPLWTLLAFQRWWQRFREA